MLKSLILSTTVAALFGLNSAQEELSLFDDDFLHPNTLPVTNDYTIPINRTFVDRNIYTVRFRLGTNPGTNVNLVLATNSEWTMVTSVNCTQEFGCERGVFDARKSDTEVIDWVPRVQIVNVGRQYTLIGHNATDVLYFENGIEFVEQNFPFFIIESLQYRINEQKRRFPYDGILGLSPDVDGDDYLTLGVPLPIHLKNKGKIKRAVIGIDMRVNSQSTMTIGKIDESKFRNTTEKEATLRWNPVTRNTTRFAWLAEMKNVFYNRESFDDGYRNWAVFDSFYGGVHLPLSEWTPLFEAVQRNLTQQRKNYLQCNMTTYNCRFNGECRFKKEDWKNFAFNFIDDRAYEVAPDAYLLDMKDGDGFNYCQIAIYGNVHNTTEYILGDVFMQSLYVVLDYENSQFAVNGNYITVDQMGEKKEREVPTSNSMVWIIIGAVVGVLVIVGIIGFIIIRQKNGKLKRNLATYETL